VNSAFLFEGEEGMRFFALLFLKNLEGGGGAGLFLYLFKLFGSLFFVIFVYS